MTETGVLFELSTSYAQVPVELPLFLDVIISTFVNCKPFLISEIPQKIYRYVHNFFIQIPWLYIRNESYAHCQKVNHNSTRYSQWITKKYGIFFRRYRILVY